MKKLTLVAAGLAAAAVTLTGCTPAPSVAVVVEGVQVPTSVVLDSVPPIVTYLQETPTTAQLGAANAFAREEVSRVIAARHNLVVTDAEVNGAIAASPTAAAVAAADGGGPFVRAVIYTSIVLDRLGEQVYAQELPSVQVEMNPRFGGWNPATGGLVDTSLSTVAPKA